MTDTDEITVLARQIIARAKDTGLLVTTAESCTGGLVAAAITDIAGSSVALDRGFVTYSNAAKQEMLGVSADSLDRFGAVSEPVAKEMAYGALSNSRADVSVSVTGIAGPSGGTAEKPVGLVWFGICRMGQAPTAAMKRFASTSRSAIRQASVATALQLLLEAMD